MKMKLPDNNSVLHANALVYGSCGILVSGKSGSGKTSLMLNLIEHARINNSFAAIVSDDQTRVCSSNGRLLAHRIDTICGLVEIRGMGIVPVQSIESSVVDFIAELIDPQLIERLPDEKNITLQNIALRKIQVPTNNVSVARRMILNTIAAIKDT